MRPVSFADLEVAIRVLLDADQGQRTSLAQCLIERAHLADQYRQTRGRPHPEFGTGTLMSAAQKFKKQPRPAVLAADELKTTVTIVNALLAHCVHQSA